MKFWLPFLVVVLFSCAQEEVVHTFPEEELVKEDEELPVDEQVLDSVIIDSAYQFSIGSYDFLIEDLDSGSIVVRHLEYIWSGDSIEAIALQNDSFVHRDSLGLVFKSIAKDSSLHLIDDMTESFSEYIHYYFDGDAEDTTYWKNYVSLYEESMMLLVEKRDLDSTFLIGEEYFNPGRNLLVSTNVDLESQFDVNGIQLLENNNNQLNDIGIQEFDEFGFDKIQWISNNSFIARKIKIDWDNNVSYILSWVKVTVTKK